MSRATSKLDGVIDVYFSPDEFLLLKNSFGLVFDYGLDSQSLLGRPLLDHVIEQTSAFVSGRATRLV